jgi:phosphoribosylamine--glycine ligase
LSEFGVPVFGPTAAAAQLESSKSFARTFMQQAKIPGPEFAVFHEESEALDFLLHNRGPRVVKADGLAAGKGVFVCENETIAADAVRLCMSGGVFGNAGKTVVLEEMLVGSEVSVFAFSDGENISSLTAARDYKRAENGGLGPNTGGMGSFSLPSVAHWSEEISERVEDAIIRPVIEKMQERGTPYRGALYAGLMLTQEGPKVLEFNCRFGDPEAQTLMPRLLSDPLELMYSCYDGSLNKVNLQWDDRKYVGVVMASQGYPAVYSTGHPITGLSDEYQDDAMVFCAGVAKGPDGNPVTSGGRVVTVVGGGADLNQATVRAYTKREEIHFEGAKWRSDIGSASPD